MKKECMLRFKRYEIKERVLEFFLMLVMFFPVGYDLLKISLLGILFICIIKKNRIVIKSKALIIYVIANLMFTSYGMFMQNKGSFESIRVDIVYPLIFSIIFLELCNIENIEKISKIVIFMSTVIAIYDVIYCISIQKGISLPKVFYFDNLELIGSNYYGYTHATTRHIGMLLFGLPFTMSYVYNNECLIKREKRNMIFSLLIQYICVILVLRTALVIVAILSPLVVWFSFFIVGKRKKISLGKVGVFLGILFLLFITYDYLYMVYGACNSKINNEMGNSIRTTQARLLIETWKKSPLIGFGSGASLKGFIRDYEHPWAYELTYYAMLFQKGIIGTIINLGFFMYIILKLLVKARNSRVLKNDFVAYAIGMMSFLLANAVDPYLGKFGYMWTVYIPFAYSCISCKGREYKLKNYEKKYISKNGELSYE